MIKFNAKAEGLDGLTRKLAKLAEPEFAREAMSDGMYQGAKTIQERVKQLAPFDTERLKDNIIIRKFGYDFAVLADAPHAHLQEFGTVNHGANPFLRPGYDEMKNKVTADLERYLASKIMEVAND